MALSKVRAALSALERKGSPVDPKSVIDCIIGQDDSRLMQLFARHLPALSQMDFQKLLGDARTTQYDLTWLDIALMQEFTQQMDAYWHTELGIPTMSTRLTKHIGLLGALVYEHFSKTFGEQKPLIDNFWHGYVTLQHDGESIYNPPTVLRDALKERGLHGLQDLVLRSCSVHAFENEPILYKGQRFTSRSDVKKFERAAYTHLATEFAKKAGNRSSRALLHKLHQGAGEAVLLLENECDNALRQPAGEGAEIGDYSQGAGSISLLRIHLEKYLLPVLN